MKIIHGDCRATLPTLDADSVDAVVTDPPYHLTTGKKGGTGIASLNLNSPAGRARISTGFMGKEWDGGDIAFRPELWAEVLRVLKPGGHVAAFGASRGYHRMACAIEDAGFEIRDSLMWVYGTGFPKSHSMREIDRPELGTALKPAFEPIVLARKPLSEKTVAANVLRWGTGALNIDGCRVEATDSQLAEKYASVQKAGPRENSIYGSDSRDRAGSAPHVNGRWPANVVHDGSDEVVGAFPDTTSGAMKREVGAYKGENVTTFLRGRSGPHNQHGDSGSAARFFYSAKASRADRAGSKHPTVKPIALMQWLARLITPPGGTVLDPFAGSGTTGAACDKEGFDCVLIEREAEYVADIRRRLGVNAAIPSLEDMLA